MAASEPLTARDVLELVRVTLPRGACLLVEGVDLLGGAALSAVAVSIGAVLVALSARAASVMLDGAAAAVHARSRFTFTLGDAAAMRTGWPSKMDDMVSVVRRV